MTSALGPETCALLGAELCACPSAQHKTATMPSTIFWLAQRFSAANQPALLRGALAPVVRLLIIPPPPPAPARSAEFASVPARARWNRTTPAKCVPHRLIRLHQWRSLPVPATAECSRPSRPAAPAPHCSIAHPRPGLPAECAPPAAPPPPDGYRLRRPRNSLPEPASSTLTMIRTKTASATPWSHLRWP